MNINVSIDSIEIQKCGEKIHKGEYNINKCVFSFSKEYTKKLVSIAVFTTINGSYKRNILNNECDIPFEVLQEKGSVELGVYSYEIDEDGVLKLRYSPSSSKFYVETGSYRNAKESVTPSVSEFEKYVYIFNDNAIEKTKEFNLNADNRKKEIDALALEVSKDKEEIIEIEKRVSVSEQNAKTSEQEAQNSANKALESENNITAMQEDINASKSHIDEQKGKVDKSVDDVEKLVEEATIQANISKEQADISIEKAGQVSADKNAVESMMTEVSTMRTSVEQTKTDTEQIKADTQGVYDNTVAIKEETLEAKTEVENSLENERIESDKKYARAIETDEIVIDGAGRVELDENGYMKDVSIESNLPEITQDVREGHNKFYLPITNFTKSGLEVDVKSHSCLSIRGTPTSTYFAERIYEKDLKMYLENGKTYTLYVEPEFRSAKTKVAFQITFNNDNDILFSSGSTMWLTNGRAVKTFTPNYTGEINLARVVVEGMDIGENYDFDLKVELVEGSYTLDTVPAYEEYGASPSLEYPSEFENLIKNVPISNCQENLLDMSNAKGGSNAGITVTVNNDGTYNYVGTATGLAVNVWLFGDLYNTNPIFILKAGTYYIKDIRLYSIEKCLGDNGSTFTLEKDTAIRAVRAPQAVVGQTYNEIKYPMIVRLEDKDMPYAPYEGYIKELKLSEGQFLGKFEGFENYIKDNKLYNNLKIYNITGDESFVLNTTVGLSENNLFISGLNLDVKLMDNNNPVHSLSNYFKFLYDFSSDTEHFYLNKQGTLFAYANKEMYPDVATFKAKLKELYNDGTPVQILYITAEELEEDLSIENKSKINSLKVYKGINNIYSNCKIRFKTNKNIKNHIEKRLEEVKDIERNISNNKYAKTLKDSVTDKNFVQVYADNPKIDKLVIKGEQLKQKVRQGYNLLPYPYVNGTKTHNGITFTDNGDGSVTMNGTATDKAEYSFQWNNMLLNDYYTYIVFNLPDSCYGNFYSVGGVYGERVGNYNKSAAGEQVNLGMSINVPTGVTVSNVTIYPMLVKGQFTRETIPVWEQYGASPSLDYPSEIEITREQDIQTNKNNFCKGYENTANSLKFFHALYVKGLKPSTTYTIAFKSNAIGNIYYINEELASAWLTVRPTGERQVFTFKTRDDITKAYIPTKDTYTLFKNSIDQPLPNEFEEVMLVEGTHTAETMPEYEPFEGEEYNVILPEGDFNNAIGDFKNEVKKIKDRWCMVNYIKKLVLDGTENWRPETTSVGKRFFLDLKEAVVANSNKNPTALCTHFSLGKDGSTWGELNLFVIYQLENFRRLAFGSFDNISEASEWKAILQEQKEKGTPIMVYYTLVEPEILELPEETQELLNSIELMDGLNNISIDKGIMSFEYNKSLARAFEEEKENNASLQAQIDEIKALLSSTSTASLLAENLAKDNESEVI